MSPRVTVLMTVYNGLSYLRQAIESVLDQTFTDFEFLIIDDASTDDSMACIQSYRDSRIRLLCNERNLGQARSLNKGLKVSEGKYVARHDQDDVSLPERLRKEVAFLEERPDVVIVCSWEYFIDSHGRKMRAWRSKLDNYGAFLGTVLIGKCPVWHPSVMFRRNVVVDLSGYDESYAPADDFDLWVRLAMQRYNAAIVPEFLVLARRHEGSQSVKSSSTQLKNARRSHDKLIRAFCNGPEAGMVALLLRMEGAFLSQCKAKSQVGVVLRALDEMLTNLQTVLRLSPEEFVTLTRVVYRRLGLGVRLGNMLVRLPPILLYPVFFSLSPLLVPRVRHVVSALYGKFCALRYPGRLVQVAVERIMNIR